MALKHRVGIHAHKFTCGEVGTHIARGIGRIRKCMACTEKKSTHDFFGKIGIALRILFSALNCADKEKNIISKYASS